jgi:hypothetical protein
MFYRTPGCAPPRVALLVIEHMPTQHAREVDQEAVEHRRRPIIEHPHAAEEFVPEGADHDQRVRVRAVLGEVELDALLHGVHAVPGVRRRRRPRRRRRCAEHGAMIAQCPWRLYIRVLIRGVVGSCAQVAATSTPARPTSDRTRTCGAGIAPSAGSRCGARSCARPRTVSRVATKGSARCRRGMSITACRIAAIPRCSGIARTSKVSAIRTTARRPGAGSRYE